MSIENLIAELASKSIHFSKINSSISGRGVDWHIDHTLKSIIIICNTLESSRADDYKWNFSLTRELVLLTGFIPRGKGKAPQVVNSKSKIELKNIEEQLNMAKELISKVQYHHPKSNFDHPFLGKMNLKKSIRFLEVHTRHHLKIIDDILTK